MIVLTIHRSYMPTRRPMTFFTELATNATNNNVDIIMYVGNDDAISPHLGTEGVFLSRAPYFAKSNTTFSHHTGM